MRSIRDEEGAFFFGAGVVAEQLHTTDSPIARQVDLKEVTNEFGG